jgi:AcrR family transcriptional regulator
MTKTARPPGRPRSEASHQAIVQATLELLLEGGYRALTMEDVRTRAGVGKATIYRRWASKEELVAEVISYLHQDLEGPDTGSLRGDFAAVAQLALSGAQHTGAATFLPRLLAESVGNPELHAIFTAALVNPRRHILRRALERAAARGEIREDLDLEVVIDLLVGPMLYRILINGGDVSGLEDRPRELLGLVLEGIAPRP